MTDSDHHDPKFSNDIPYMESLVQGGADLTDLSSSGIKSQRQRNTISIGMMIGIGSWAMMFITLLWGYVVYRMHAAAWLQDGLTPLSRVLAYANTVVLLGSSACFRKVAWRWYAFALGILFLLGQVYLWKLFLGQGINWKVSIAGSFFYALTGFHALHIVGGLIAMFFVCLRLRRFKDSLFDMGVQYFWDLLLLVWVVLFALIFIVQ